MNMKYKIRYATEGDCEEILRFIKELAEYEKMKDLVIASVEDIRKTIFSPKSKAEVLILEEEGKYAGFALFFHNYSTFLCRYGIYVEDIYVREEFRGKGYGKAFFKFICTEAVKRNCGRVEWWCLDWNKPSIDFYIGLGAEPMSDWTVYRLNETQIRKLAER